MDVQEKLATLFPAAGDIPAAFDLAEPITQEVYLADGELKIWDGPWQDVFSPVYMADRAEPAPKFLGRYPLMTSARAEEIMGAAVRAYANGRGLWPTLSVRERIRHTEEFVYRFRKKRDEVVRIMMWEIGKSLQDSRKEFDRTVDYVVDTIEALKDLDRVSASFVIEEGIIGQIRRSPLGVVLCMGPFNYPLNETFTVLIPALIMGNPVVFKPPKLGVLLFHPLLEVFRDSFPPGVINTIYGHGREIATPLMRTGKIDVLAFIGTSKPADELKKAHPRPHRLRSVLGLEAKNPAIILPDADLDLAVAECFLGALSFNGQRCSAIKIIFVHTAVRDEFLKNFSKTIESKKFGMPWEDGVAYTPLPEPGKPAFLTELLEDARQHGAQVTNPGGGLQRGSFFYPAVVYPVNEQMRLYHEEQFGPVIPVVPFEEVETPIQYIINSNYGQQASIFSRNPDIIARLIDPLVNQVSRVNINSQCQRGPDTFPWTGRKDSAELTLSVTDALRVFSIRALVAAKGSDLNKEIITTIVRQNKSSFLSTDFIL
jgi:glyceraldehyde-3-phosphate dehydrogenase (NADP+)